MSLCLWKEKGGVDERGREKDGHKNQIQINVFFLWKMKGVVEKKSQKKRREDQTVRSLCWCDEGPGAMGS